MEIYQRIFEYAPDAMLVLGRDGLLRLVNAHAETLFGYDRSELLGQTVELLVPARFTAQHAAHRARFMEEAQSRQMGRQQDLYALRKDGSEFPVDIMLSPMIMGGEHLTLCVVRDITERKAAQDALEHQTNELLRLHAELELLANHDGLTGLYNWRAFYEHAGQLLTTAHRRHEKASLLILDLDHFKQINDRFGHAEGDRVLQAAAAALKASARQNDIVARHGGEEFVIAGFGLSEAESLVAAERLRAAVASIENLACRVTTSVGVATFVPDPSSRHEPPTLLADLLDRADQALYHAKRSGRNRICHFDQLGEDIAPASDSP
ncbi:Putative diguanylate cyclase (GGDEF domain) with PAS/PAC sensor domain [Thiobacillus denitrificans ATCC 25259]|uniref:diguanylate cyclase n=1 Tax=Thiobacillus denitrificans (strain ATCC 25259 / T1) TaxID=292415 RepID=Q3SF49_THIDA|nr:diguanylate cyclase [Thiobacillus denitrificans]AAZ98767.1 Putative diguanylate cyclase (GGDEF domain) with PAS/PAC sensor domain [Thiobacillus denitrificans ATCC 25259]